MPDWLSWPLSLKFHPAVLSLAVTIAAAVAAATGAALASSILFGRNLGSFEVAALAAAFAALGWGLTASHRRRERKRILEMRDSALW